MYEERKWGCRPSSQPSVRTTGPVPYNPVGTDSRRSEFEAAVMDWRKLLNEARHRLGRLNCESPSQSPHSAAGAPPGPPTRIRLQDSQQLSSLTTIFRPVDVVRLSAVTSVASVALAGLLTSLASAQTQRVSWDEKAPYADRMMYNGQRYKTINVTDKINVWASMNHTSTLTIANVVIMNEGQERFDVDPERFICVCTSPKQKVLKHDWPFGLEKNTTLQILRANTVLPGSDLKGMVSFERIRRCDAMRLVIIRVSIYARGWRWNGQYALRPRAVAV